MPATLCRKCGFNNPPGMRFCGNCGTRLGATGILVTAQLPTPPNLANLSQQVGVMMGADLLERFHQAGLEASGQRRNVTLLFADLTGFTGLSQRLDTEELFVVIQQFASLLARSVYKFEGMVDKFIGDGIMAIFGAPIAQENNAEMAIRAALDMQQELDRFSQEVQEHYKNEVLRLHIGLHTGSVIVGSMGSSLMMNYTAIGDTVNLAARLQQNADPGTILVSHAVYQFTRPLFDFEPLTPLSLKGYAAPVQAYRLIGPRQTPSSVRGIAGLSAPLIGRATEFNALRDAVDHLIEFKHGQLILIEGEAGIGKSRLTAELRTYLRPLPVRVLLGQSYTYRRTAAHWVFQDLLLSLFGLQQNIPEPLALTTIKDHLTRLLGREAAETLPYIDTLLSIGLDRPEVTERTRYLDAAQLRQRIFLAVRTVLLAEARQAPLVLIFEDIHWADEASLDLLIYLLDSIADAPLLMLGISRQYSEESLNRLVQKAERDLTGRFLHLRLIQLSSEDSQQLLKELLVIPDLPAGLHNEIITRAAGNPFYLEEILRMLIDEQKIIFQDQAWRLAPGTSLEPLGVPDTLQGLILARFDRLELIQRRVLQVASVMGRNFSSAVLAAVMQTEDIDPLLLPATLDGLEQRGFVLPQAGLSDFDYLIKHILVSDAIYSTLLKSERSDLHGQVGEAIEGLFADHTAEQVELLARHYGASNRYDRALHYLILAGQQEARNYANQQARHSFEQALEILDRIEHTPAQAVDTRIGLGDVLVFTGEYPAALQQYHWALDVLEPFKSSQSAQLRSRLYRKLSTVQERQGNYDQALADLASAQMALAELPESDPIENAWILNTVGWIHLRRGDLDAAAAALNQALILVEGTREYDIISSIYNRLGGVAYQKGRLKQASDFVRRSLELRQRIGDVNGVASSYNNLGLLNWRYGDLDSALDNFKHSVEVFSSLGDVEGIIINNSNHGLVYLDRGDFENAFSRFSQALALAKQIGGSYHIGSCYLHLARYSLFRQDWPQALEYARFSEQTFAGIGVQEHRVYGAIYTSLAYLGQGKLADAHAAARTALDLLAEISPGPTPGASEEHAHALRMWGQVLRAEGAGWAEVEAALRQSVVEFRTVGNQIELARSQRLLGEVLAVCGRTSEAQALQTEAHQVIIRLGAKLD